jgi:two-component system CitB family response regulator
MLTAATDGAVVRQALGRGVLNYLVKPFSEEDLAQRLCAYSRFHSQFGGDRTLDQPEIDNALRALHEGDRLDVAVRKGRSSQTSQLVAETVRTAAEPLTATGLAARLGLSRATAQRYLADLAADGRVTVRLRYGTTGRPEHLYRWCAAPRARRPRRP